MTEFVWNQRIQSYAVDEYKSSTINDEYSIRLVLANGDTVSITFQASPPADFVTLGTAYHQIRFASSRFDRTLHLLQTEAPLYFTAYEAGSPPIRFAGISTTRESVGEGLTDADATAV